MNLREQHCVCPHRCWLRIMSIMLLLAGAVLILVARCVHCIYIHIWWIFERLGRWSNSAFGLLDVCIDVIQTLWFRNLLIRQWSKCFTVGSSWSQHYLLWKFTPACSLKALMLVVNCFTAEMKHSSVRFWMAAYLSVMFPLWRLIYMLNCVYTLCIKW